MNFPKYFPTSLRGIKPAFHREKEVGVYVTANCFAIMSTVVSLTPFR